MCAIAQSTHQTRLSPSALGPAALCGQAEHRADCRDQEPYTSVISVTVLCESITTSKKFWPAQK